MRPDQNFDFDDVAVAKQRSRQRDADDLASGAKSREALSAENDIFASVGSRLRVRIGDAKPLR